MTENLEVKAHRYLTEGRVAALLVDPAHGRGRFTVQGSGDDPYVVRYAGEWICDCPARVPVCAHVLACQRITCFDAVKPLFERDDDDLTTLLSEALA